MTETYRKESQKSEGQRIHIEEVKFGCLQRIAELECGQGEPPNRRPDHEQHYLQINRYRNEPQKEDSIVRFGQTWFTIFKDMNNE